MILSKSTSADVCKIASAKNQVEDEKLDKRKTKVTVFCVQLD